MILIYIGIFLLLFLAVIYEYVKGAAGNKTSNILFVFFSGLLTIMSAIRYGSGSDYFGYMWHYNQAPEKIGQALTVESHMNPGYNALMSLCKSFNLNYEGFIFVLSAVLMISVVYLIWKYSKFKNMSLLIFYCLYYHIYINSALRQGITLIIFLWAYYTFAKKDKMLQYCLVIIAGSLLHYSILVMLCLPIIKFVYKNFASNKLVNISFIIIALLCFIFKVERILPIIGNIIGISIPYTSSSASIMAIMLRLVLVAFVFIMYKFSDKNKLDEFDKFEIYTYYIGVLIFIAVSNTPNLSRLTEFFSILDIFIIANLIKAIKVDKVKVLSTVFAVLVIGVVFIKDQASFIQQGNYESSNILEYPYVTIFNKAEIFQERKVEVGLIPSEYKSTVGRFKVYKYRSNEILKSLYKEKYQQEANTGANQEYLKMNNRFWFEDPAN